jgi:Ca-activated chloride channel family protein
VNGKRQEFVYEGTFPAVQSDNTFISSLWATRRVGFLLDEIRLRGENAELKDEVIHLSRDFGIMTPYTSFLVLEDDKAYAQHGIGRMGSGGGKPAAKSDGFLDNPATESSPRMVPVFAADSLSAARMPANEPGDRVITRSERGAAYHSGFSIGGGIDADTSDLREQSGSRAVKMSKRIQAYKGLETAASDMAAFKHVGRKVFTLVEGRWIDTAFKSTLKITTIKFGSEEYFKLLKDKPDLKEVLALGTKVTVVLEDGTALVVE